MGLLLRSAERLTRRPPANSSRFSQRMSRLLSYLPPAFVGAARPRFGSAVRGSMHSPLAACITQHYTLERISYWLRSPTALEFRGLKDGRNAVCLRRAER